MPPNLVTVLQSQQRRFAREAGGGTTANLLLHVDEKNITRWWFLVHGLEGAFAGGEYVFLLEAPADFPTKPPRFSFVTPNGVFTPGGPICTSIGELHAEDHRKGAHGGYGWRPSLGMAGFAVQVVNFMICFDQIPSGGIRIEQSSPGDKRRLAAASRQWNHGARARAGHGREKIDNQEPWAYWLDVAQAVEDFDRQLEARRVAAGAPNLRTEPKTIPEMMLSDIHVAGPIAFELPLVPPTAEPVSVAVSEPVHQAEPTATIPPAEPIATEQQLVFVIEEAPMVTFVAMDLPTTNAVTTKPDPVFVPAVPEPAAVPAPTAVPEPAAVPAPAAVHVPAATAEHFLTAEEIQQKAVEQRLAALNAFRAQQKKQAATIPRSTTNENIPTAVPAVTVAAEPAAVAVVEPATEAATEPATEPATVAVEPSTVAVEPTTVADEPTTVAVEPATVVVEPATVAVVEPATVAAVEPATPAPPHGISIGDGIMITDSDLDSLIAEMQFFTNHSN